MDSGDRMNETKIIANLPALDIEITRQHDPDDNARSTTIQMRAGPSFDAAARYFPPMAATMGVMAANPAVAWARFMQAAWMPWLGLMRPMVGILGLAPRSAGEQKRT